MPQTIQQLFGANATLVNGELTIKLSDLTAYGLDTTKPGAIMNALLIRANDVLKGDTIANDPTAGVSAPSFNQAPTFYTRGDATQIGTTRSLIFYELFTNSSDPDNTI